MADSPDKEAAGNMLEMAVDVSSTNHDRKDITYEAPISMEAAPPWNFYDNEPKLKIL